MEIVRITCINGVFVIKPDSVIKIKNILSFQQKNEEI